MSSLAGTKRFWAGMCNKDSASASARGKISISVQLVRERTRQIVELGLALKFV